MTARINSSYVRALLGKKEMSIPDLANQVGVSEQTIYNLLAGGGWRSETIGKLADVLETTPSDLISNRAVHVTLAPNGHGEPEAA